MKRISTLVALFLPAAFGGAMVGAFLGAMAALVLQDGDQGDVLTPASLSS